MREQQGASAYLHWDELRHRTPPDGLTTRQWWLVQKLARRGTPLPLLGTNGKPSRSASRRSSSRDSTTST